MTTIDRVLSYFNHRNDGRLPPCEPHLTVAPDGNARGHFRGCELSSAFQPLLAAGTLEVVAHEALLRAADTLGVPLSPSRAFALPANRDETTFFDRLCRTVHAINFAAQRDAASDLFLNIDGGHLLAVEGGHGRTFETILHHCGLAPHRIVIELIESRIDDAHHLADAIGNYRRLGYRIAIDDFGCQDSNFDRLWRLTPDIVKLDRSLIVQAESNRRARRILPMLVDIVHELGAVVVCEGIETRSQHELASDAGADLLQGFLYAMPNPRLHAGVGAGLPFAPLRKIA